MHDLDERSAVETTVESTAVVKYGLVAVEVLSLIIVAVVFLPNGSYRSGNSVVYINALTPPFGDYGMAEVSIVGVVILLTIAARVMHLRVPRRSAWALLATYAGVFGWILPDSWTRNTIVVSKGLGSRVIGVKLEIGFWLDLSLVATLLIIAAIVLWNEPRPGHPAGYRRAEVPIANSN